MKSINSSPKNFLNLNTLKNNDSERNKKKNLSINVNMKKFYSQEKDSFQNYQKKQIN